MKQITSAFVSLLESTTPGVPHAALNGCRPAAAHRFTTKKCTFAVISSGSKVWWVCWSVKRDVTQSQDQPDGIIIVVRDRHVHKETEWNSPMIFSVLNR